VSATTTERPPEPTLAAVARTAPAAAALARRLSDAGLRALPLDLEEALDGGPPVAVVDPEGWEDACRRSLSAFEARRSCPPAVLLTGPDPLVIHRVEPSYGFLPLDREPRRAVAMVARAARARQRFASLWPEPLVDVPRPERVRIAEALEAAAGIELRPDREGALLQAVRTRMVGRLVATAREYAAAVSRGKEEVAALAALLSVGETYFWRYSGQYLALQDLLAPLLREPGRQVPLRIWSAGCASGEEVYSLAIAGMEADGGAGRVEVVGTDLNPAFLAQARVGHFRERSLRNLPPHLNRKYLEPVEGGARAGEALRARVRFEALNLGGAELAPWAAANGPFHAVFCRNTLIYLSRRAADRIVAAMVASLVAGGGLFLGASESLLSRRPDLEVCRGMGSFYYRRAALGPEVPARTDRESNGEPDGEPDGERAGELYAAGLDALDAEQFDEARRLFGEILALRVEDARGHAGLAILLANEGREAEAAAHLDRASRSGPPVSETPYLRGLLAERRGDELEALRHYREALGTDPGFFMAHLNRAWVLRRLGREDGFADEMRSALAILKTRPKVAPWLTGGMGQEGLLGLVADALAGRGGG